MYKFILSLTFVFVGCQSAKILGVFPTPSISHQVVFRPVMQELAKRGHEVTVITTDPAFPKGQAPKNLSEIDVHDVSYELWNAVLAKTGKEKDQLVIFELLADLLSDLLKEQLQTDEIQKLLQDNKSFDLIFVEACVRPALIFSHIFNAPVIEFSSLGGVYNAFEEIGAPSHPLIYPEPYYKRIHNLTLWEKVTELYNHYLVESLIKRHIDVEDKMLKSMFGPDIPDLSDLKRNVQMMFINVHPIWDFNRPVPPNLVYLGGLHQKPQKELPKDLKSYLDSSKNGVIYISFGTNVKTSWLIPEKIKIFTEVFSKLPYDVLWKWDSDELQGRPKNVKISKWLPQSDLLRHPKVKLFITQGGLQSTDEAITAGVPLIGVPMLGDQWFNVEQYVKLNIGKQLSIETLTQKQLTDAIKTVIDDESYRQNIIKLRDVIYDQPLSSLERAVWWTEHVLRHGGGAHLRASSANMHWTEYYELKTVLVLLAAFVLLFSVTVLTIVFIISNVKYIINDKKVKVN